MSNYKTYRPTLTDADVIHAAIIMATFRFIEHIDNYHQDPSCLAELETVDLDGWSVESNEPLNFPEIKLITRHGYKESK